MIAWTDQVTDSAPGEAVALEERLVLAPCSGRFCPSNGKKYTSEGEYVMEGQIVGSVLSSNGQEVPIRSNFAGWMMGYMLPQGAPVRGSEPVLWLRQK
ncbi:MAG TPA: hypothetical protein VHJ78_04030 [Actinomycetota bacterium]|nr:hypothetical protein [Actinomycetota bacterium]